MPSWWRSDADHWPKRTTALTAILAFIAVVVFGIFSIKNQQNPSGNDKPPAALQTADPTSAAAPGQPGMCSPDSEGQVADGWGPDRPTYHDDTFPTALTFNSTTDNANTGDERNFVWIKPIDTKFGSATSPDSVEVHDGQQYNITVYVRLDGPDKHEAKGTKLVVNLPTCTGHRVAVSALLTSLDAFPGQVWDGAAFWARKDFNLALVPDSGMVYGNAWPGGLPFSANDLVSAKGIPLGSQQLDGVFKPGYGNSVYVTLKVRAQVAP